jgi:hypothetical protein
MGSRLIAVALLTVLAAGCATAPDGSKIQRLAEPAAPAPLSAEEAMRLTELNAQILRDQNAVRLHEERIEALRAAPPAYVWGPTPYFGAGWGWGNPGWGWRTHWGVGFGW